MLALLTKELRRMRRCFSAFGDLATRVGPGIKEAGVSFKGFGQTENTSEYVATRWIATLFTFAGGCEIARVGDLASYGVVAQFDLDGHRLVVLNNRHAGSTGHDVHADDTTFPMKPTGLGHSARVAEFDGQVGNGP